MSKRIAFLFPGQGAQYVGMGRDFYDHFKVARDLFNEADDLLHQNFSRLIFEGPAAELTLTKNSQLSIYIMSMAVLRTLQAEFPSVKPKVCAGLSLGEYTALTASGRVTFEDCLPLVQARAQLMNDACNEHEGSMQVILGLDAGVVEECIQEISESERVWVANFNCPGQVVISGTKEGLVAAVKLLLSKGAKRALPLDVSGAFHSGLMQDAQEGLKPYIKEVSLSPSPIGLVMNMSGNFVSDTDSMRTLLIEQVVSPVRWEQGIAQIEKEGIDLFLEVGCGKTLAGMNKRIGVKVPTHSIERVADLKEVSQWISY
jgi:[acyl-carrier-protein] S-malonyltransferase